MMLVMFLMVILVSFGTLFWHFSRSQDVLKHWADQNRYQIIEAKYAHFKGPFFWKSSKGQSVYRVVVQDQQGRTKSGWVLCGSWAWGVMNDQTREHWDE